MQIESLAELLAYDKENDWFSAQSSSDLEHLADILIDMELAADPIEYDEIRNQLNSYDEDEAESREALERVQGLLAAGRLDDALLLIERTLHPRRSLPMRKEAAAA